MSKHDILEMFKDINYEYNDSTRFTTLKNMLNEMCEDCGRVAVVRCKDCTHYEELRTGEGACHLNGKISWYIREDWFCADGERKAEDDQSLV